MTSKLQITMTDPNSIENEPTGKMLVSEFLEPSKLGVAQLVGGVGGAPERIVTLADGARPIDGKLDLQLGRYFGLSEGLFLRLQDQYELLEAKRALNGELDKILPRAA